MPGRASCPHCGQRVCEPGLLAADYRCPRHGPVAAAFPAVLAGPDRLRPVMERSEVPFWLPWPLPAGWLMTGARWAADPTGRITAAAVGISGPGLADGPTDMVVVAEKPGTGLAAALAGIPGTDPGGLVEGPAAARVHCAGRPTALWSAPCRPDRCVYLGEWGGDWLWWLGWPQSSLALVHSAAALVDLRAMPADPVVPLGALNPRLTTADAGIGRA